MYICTSALDLLMQTTVLCAVDYVAGRCKWIFGDEEANPAEVRWVTGPTLLKGPCRATRSKTH